MASPTRITTEHHVTALVAPDSILPLARRVQRIVSHNRTLAVAHSYATYLHRPPEIHASLRVVDVRDGHGIWVSCEPHFGFGFDIDDRAGDRSEDDAWRRYHAAQHEAERFGDRRRFMTEVTLTGGREQDDPRPDDSIVIRRYNADGVCDERVIGFGA
jgi:hypothetical protein